MEPELNVHEDTNLAAVRRRGLLFLNYVFWALAVSALLVGANLCASLFAHWIALLEGTRKVFGVATPVGGPDYWTLAGVATAALAVVSVLLLGWRFYRRAWQRRIGDFHGAHARIRTLRRVADASEAAVRMDYVRALSAQPDWRTLIVGPDYKENASAALKALEIDIAHRAVTAGLVVGLNRNPLIDSFSILGAALELQFYVLTRLRKRPSLRTWTEMWKRTSSSLFLNWYISRGDALYLKLAIKKAAWGLGFASDLTDQASQTLEDIDWDEIASGMGGSIPPTAMHVMSALGTVAAKGMTVGAFGLRQLSHFVETTADDLLQGVLAGGILYYHGMALAAECLALDEEHRNSPAMNRTISQAMSVACAPAGRVLLDQVRAMRQFLRERRRLMFEGARNTAVKGATSLKDRLKATANRAYDTLSGGSSQP